METTVSSTEALIFHLHRIQAIKFGNFSLKSGLESPIYVDVRQVISYPQFLKKIASTLWNEMQGLTFDLICGVPYTALPIATAISLDHSIPMVMRRKEVKDYGTKKEVEGVFRTGQRCVIIEDIITSGTSIFETIESLEKVGLIVEDILVLIDREQGGRANLESKGYRLHSVFSLEEILNTLEAADRLDSKVAANVRTFIQTNQVTR